ncbi:hypothetical protein BB561_000078 [Smittium simulii]|uniref:UmuC domain-containing protein n=1 Tax=Smittium simulii TaxID=133385 RepID=A0A2T9Z0Q8_9FUNG|nr:hypothetical protein BB561_000078 [Smittium simulii]
MSKQIITEADYAKVISHIDLDCFYCQVEQRRLGISDTVPLCVAQWGNLVAVNYAARKYGIMRNESVNEAKLKCPDLISVHVATFAPGKKAGYHLKPNQATHKVCLDVYRRASRQIFSVIQNFTTEYQKGSIDEAYINITQLVNDEIDKQISLGNIEFVYDNQSNEKLPVINWSQGGIATKYRVGSSSDDRDFGWSSLRSYYGAIVTARIRDAIFSQLGFTCSAGVSHSRILSKLGSSLNKPNKQAIILQTDVPDFIGSMKLEKLRFLGGKLGKNIKELLGVETVSDMQRHSLEKLEGFFPLKTARFIYKSCRGIDPDVVPSSTKPKSFSSVKSFGNISKLTTLQQVQDWVAVLSTDIWERLMEQQDIDRYWPKKLTLTMVSSKINVEARNCSKNFPLHFCKNVMESPELLIKSASELVIQLIYNTKNKKSLPSIFPVECLLLHTTQFYSYDINHKNKQITNWVSQSTLKINKSELQNSELTYDRTESAESHIVSSFSTKHYRDNLYGSSKKSPTSKKKPLVTITTKKNSTTLLSPKKNLFSYFDALKKSETHDQAENLSSEPFKTQSDQGKISIKPHTQENPTTPNIIKADPSIYMNQSFADQSIYNLSENNSAISDSIDFIQCTQCPEKNSNIPSKDWASHVDYHLALKLQEKEKHAEKIVNQFSNIFKKQNADI